MQWIDQVLGVMNASFAVPGWAVLAAVAIGAAFAVNLLARSEPHDHPLTVLILAGMLLGGLLLGGALVRQIGAGSAREEARALSARAGALDAAAAQSPALGCLVADPALATPCEVVLFERPDLVSAARGLVLARIALVQDGLELERRAPSPGLEQRIGSWRRPLAQDPFGIVAAVLADYAGCTAAACPLAGEVADPARVAANLSEGRYPALMARYAPVWERNARNRGTLNPTPPTRTGPFGLAVTPHDTAANGAAAAPERAPAVNLPVEEPAAPAPAPLPPARPAARPAAAPAPAAAPRPAQPRPRPPVPEPPADSGEPAAGQ
ncbi:hypothetical protein V5F49_10565 [Xanthobacter sp. V3C-3]|uniref:hypothetical protein n=1 Tax=Xanthobacter lutulentifluminis TaxID=3119935 RepID=UPI00372C3537